MLEAAQGRRRATRRKESANTGRIVMPYATARDATRLYYEESGSGSPILFVHEFAADYASWEPQLRYFSRSHRCITYSARGYTPSDIPSADAFTCQHFRDDALAVLDHLEVERAHFVGLSMGAYAPASGLAMFPKTGHILNLEEPALFNQTLERFLALAEASRWPARDPASRRT
jgi:pimeloyl-ACP methyl ester carboxylesterase